jgi:hypothetical protein
MPAVIAKKNRNGRMAALLLCALAGACGSNKGSDTTGTSGGGDAAVPCTDSGNPTPLTAANFANFEPSLGATVSNSAIVHRFQLIGFPVAFQLTFQPVAGKHTAGSLILPEAEGGPASTWQWTVTRMDTVVQYESAPITWSQAPGHVELDLASPQLTADGCAFTLPNPFFSYDVVPAGDDNGVLDAGAE